MRSGPADVQKCLRSRSHFLRCLRRPRQKCDLVRELEESRSTIDRALRELERARFVERDDGGYRTTLAGELALAEYERYAARLAGLAEWGDVLDGLPPDEPLDCALFEDAEVTRPAQYSPHAPVERLREFLDDADHVRVFATAIIPEYVDLYRERVVEGGTTAEFVLFEGVVEWLLSRREDDLLDFFGADGVTVAETTVDHSFSLIIAEYDESTDATSGEVARSPNDRAVGVMFYEDGTLAGFVHTDARGAVAWAETRYGHIADEAVPLDRPVES